MAVRGADGSSGPDEQADCWYECGGAGACPEFCGAGGACCKDGSSDPWPCPKSMASSATHICTSALTVAPLPPPLPPPPPPLDCWNECGGVGGACPGFCGDGGACCKNGSDDPSPCPETMPQFDYHTCYIPTDRSASLLTPRHRHKSQPAHSPDHIGAFPPPFPHVSLTGSLLDPNTPPQAHH